MPSAVADPRGLLCSRPSGRGGGSCRRRNGALAPRQRLAVKGSGRKILVGAQDAFRWSAAEEKRIFVRRRARSFGPLDRECRGASQGATTGLSAAKRLHPGRQAQLFLAWPALKPGSEQCVPGTWPQPIPRRKRPSPRPNRRDEAQPDDKYRPWRTAQRSTVRHRTQYRARTRVIPNPDQYSEAGCGPWYPCTPRSLGRGAPSPASVPRAKLCRQFRL